MKKLILTVTLLTSFQTLADTSVTFGGWSKHFGNEGSEYKLNENHNGYGLVTYPYTNGNHSLGGELWFMKDSHGNDAKHYGVNYRYKINDTFSLSTSLTYMDRTFRDDYVIYRKETVTLFPYLTANIYKNLNVDITFVPKMGRETDVLFFRFNYKF